MLFAILDVFGEHIAAICRDHRKHREQTVRASAGFITGGEARLQHFETHLWDDTVVIAMIERQHGRLEGHPDQDLSLRMTHVYPRQNNEWQLVHRRADPLVATMSLDDLRTPMRH